MWQVRMIYSHPCEYYIFMSDYMLKKTGSVPRRVASLKGENTFFVLTIYMSSYWTSHYCIQSHLCDRHILPFLIGYNWFDVHGNLVKQIGGAVSNLYFAMQLIVNQIDFQTYRKYIVPCGKYSLIPKPWFIVGDREVYGRSKLHY